MRSPAAINGGRRPLRNHGYESLDDHPTEMLAVGRRIALPCTEAAMSTAPRALARRRFASAVRTKRILVGVLDGIPHLARQRRPVLGTPAFEGAVGLGHQHDRLLELGPRPRLQGLRAGEVGLSQESDISGHYSRGSLLERLRSALVTEGINPDHPTIGALAPFDHFHGRGLEATEELAASLTVSPSSASAALI